MVFQIVATIKTTRKMIHKNRKSLDKTEKIATSGNAVEVLCRRKWTKKMRQGDKQEWHPITKHNLINDRICPVNKASPMDVLVVFEDRKMPQGDQIRCRFLSFNMIFPKVRMSGRRRPVCHVVSAEKTIKLSTTVHTFLDGLRGSVI